MTEQILLPDFTPNLPGFRTDEFLALSESLLAFPFEHDQTRLDLAPFRLISPEPTAEDPIPVMPPRWYPCPAPEVIEIARESFVPPPRLTIFEGRGSELERVLRPLLSGHPIRLQGEAGTGKTAMLTAVATHERTRQRFRRIWWIDQPARLYQTLTLSMNLPHALAETDPAARRAMLTPQLDDHTLLIIDGAGPDDPVDEWLSMTPHILIAVDTVPEILDPEEPLPPDPEGVITLRALDDTAAIETLAQYAGIEDTRKIRGPLLRIAQMLGNYPLGLMLAGKLISRDGLPLDDLEAALQVEFPKPHIDPETVEESDDLEAQTPPQIITINRALDISIEALPSDYRTLFEAFGVFPMSGAPLDGLHSAAKIGTPLATRRGLTMLAQYGFIRADHRDPERYIMHPTIYARAAAATSAKTTLSKRARAWAQLYAKDSGPVDLYRAEPCLIQILDVKKDAALQTYLRDYGGLPPAAPDPSSPRGEGLRLTQVGIDLTDQGTYYAAEQALSQALDLRQANDSSHAVAETLVALARLYDATGDYTQAAEGLVDAAERVYKLGATDSLSIARRALARVYRHMGRYGEALEVLDEGPQVERAAILRAQGNYSAAVAEIDQCPDANPYLRAELYLLAGRYTDALQAITGRDDPDSAHLRAQIYHLQGSVDEAIQGYRLAIDCYVDNDPACAKTLRGLGAALATKGDYDEARKVLEEALAIHRAETTPDRKRLGRTLRLLAAVHLIAGDHTRAAEIAREALEQMVKIHAPDEVADAYRTLGRALWRTNDTEGALNAFNGESDAAQTMPDRDDVRIGLALHHLADAYRATGSLDRAAANYRRSLNHQKPGEAYLITQFALHRVLMEQERYSPALDVAQEIIDSLGKQAQPDLVQYGYAQVVRAKSQLAVQRPIRAGQSMQEWMRMLASRAGEAANDERPALRVLVLGLAARSLLAENRPTLALDTAQISLQQAEDCYPNALPAWAARRDLGEIYVALDKPEETILTLESLFEGENSTYASSFALIHSLAAQAYHKLNETMNALDHLRIALEAEPDVTLKALLDERIAAIQLEIGQPADAVETLRAGLPFVDRKEHADIAARLLTTLAHTLGGLNRYAEAITIYEEALVVLRDVEGVSPTHTADVLRSLGQTHEAQGQIKEAAHVYRRALNVLEKVESPRQMRDILHALAKVTAALGDQSAVSLYEQTRDQTRLVGTEAELGLVLCELADVHRDAARLIPSIQNYQAALEYQPADSYPRERVNTLRNLGRAFAQMERYDDARTAWTEALELSHDLPDHSPDEIALTYHAIAEAHRIQANYQDAELSYRESLHYHAPNSVAAAATWRALGQALHAAGRHQDAIDPLERALDAEKTQPQQVNARIVQTLQLLAETQVSCTNYTAAIARYHEALVYMDRALQPVLYAESLRALGKLYADAKNWDQAQIALKEALDIESSHAPRNEERISTTLQQIADTYRAAGDLEMAAEYYQKVTVYASLTRRASNDLRETLDELERRRATLQAAQQSLALLDRSDASNLKDLSFIHALIAKSYASLNQPRESADTIRSLLEILEARRENLDTDDAQPDIQALAWLARAYYAEGQNDLDAARLACQRAKHHVRNSNLRWVIEQVARSLES